MFRNVFIVESRNAWRHALPNYDKQKDLVLTYDFGLRRKIEDLGGIVRYVDNLCHPPFMQKNNFLMYQFFCDWHLDAEGADIFRYREVAFGFSFRIEIWNDFTFYVRSRLCLEQLRSLTWQKLYLEAGLPLLREVLDDMGLNYAELKPNTDSGTTFPGYYFPIHRWMHERLRARLPRHFLRDLFVTVQGLAMSWLDRLITGKGRKVGIFVQEYHPTRQLLQRLRQCQDIRVVQAHFSSVLGMTKFLKERPIPIFGSFDRYQADADCLLNAFRRSRVARLVLANGVDITDAAYRVIERKVIEVLTQSLRALDCVINYLDKHPIRLTLLIANLGQVATLVDCVAKNRGVPSYMIINGLLTNAYLDEAKYSTIINAYSKSIRDHYFRGMNNIVCLGDPRMDAYATARQRVINRVVPTVTIGASGFNHLDLNSYLAAEFEFLHEVLTAIRNLIGSKRSFRVVLKVRANGYSAIYKQFTQEYFPDVCVKIAEDVPMGTVLDETDIYISIYSQTLFEASCMGIPVVYHKCDREIMDPPFDGKSELLTTRNIPDLTRALHDFLEGNSRFDKFLDKAVMEKYIGPLDGKNLERNLDFVLSWLKNLNGSEVSNLPGNKGASRSR